MNVRGGWISAIVSTGIIVAGWAWFMNSDQFSTVWAMFGIANQMLAVIALAIVSAYLSNVGRAKYLPVTILPMCFVIATTGSAGVIMLSGQISAIVAQLQSPSINWTTMANALLQGGLIAGMLLCTAIILIASVIRIWTGGGLRTVPRGFEPVMGEVTS